MKAVVIDDEMMGRTALREKIRIYVPEIKIIGEAVNGEEGIKVILDTKPDIVFLDIEMPVKNGFEMLDCLPEKNFHLVFTTAYDDYAIKAFRYAAVDYLLKPIGIEELQQLAERIQSRSKLEKDSSKYEMLKTQYQFYQGGISRIAVPDQTGIEFIDIGDIIYLEANDNYTTIRLKNANKIIASKTLREFDEMLTGKGFLRVHNSYCVHLKYIKRYIRANGGQLELINGIIINVSRSKKEQLLNAIKYL